MKKVNSLLKVCALGAFGLALSTVGAQAWHFQHSTSNQGVMGVSFGYLVPERQESFTFPVAAMSGGYGQCHAMNLTEGRVVLVIPHDRTLVLTPQNPGGTFNMPSDGFFYAKYTMRSASGPFSVLNAPVTIFRATTSPFMSGNTGEAQASQVNLICRTY